MVQNDGSTRLLEDPSQSGAPQTPKRTSRGFIRVLAAVAAVTVALAVVGAVARVPEEGRTELLRKDFGPGEQPSFSTDTDRMVDLAVVDGAYRISIKDPSAP